MSSRAPGGNLRERLLVLLPSAQGRGELAPVRRPSVRTTLLTVVWLALAAPVVTLAMISWFFATGAAVLWKCLFAFRSKPGG